MRNVTLKEKNKMSVSGIKNKIIKLYGSFYDMKWDSEGKKVFFAFFLMYIFM